MKVEGSRPRIRVRVVVSELAINLSFSLTVSKMAEDNRGKRPPSRKVNRPNTIIKLSVLCIKGIDKARTDAKNTSKLMLASICLLRCYSLWPVFLGVMKRQSTFPRIGEINNVAIYPM